MSFRRKLCVAAAIAGLVLPAMAQAETLQDALIAAYQGNPQLGAQRDQAGAAQEQLAQARAQWRPRVTLSGSYGYERIETNRPFAANVGERSIATAQLQTVMPVYAGGRINAGIEQARAGIGAANAELRGTVQELMLQTVTAYVDVRRDLEAVDIRLRSVELLEEQFRASEDRFDVGVVTRTDVALTQARLEGGRAALAAAQAQLQGSIAVYQFLTGNEPDILLAPPPVPILPTSFEDALVIALSDNPELEASRFAERAAEAGVTGAYGALKPTVSIVGTASAQETYLNDYRETQVSATARVSVPLFEGGLTQSQVRSAKLERERTRSQTDNRERQVQAQLSQAWYSYIASQSSILASERQVDAATIAFEGAKEELSVGVRTTVDVLDQEQQLYEARLNLVRSQRDAYVAAHELLRAMGLLTPRTLGLDIEEYDPDDYGDRIRRNWLLTDID